MAMIVKDGVFEAVCWCDGVDKFLILEWVKHCDYWVFGDVYVAKGDLAMKRKQVDVPREYYKKALGIYEGKFDSEHWKVVRTRGKLR